MAFSSLHDRFITFLRVEKCYSPATISAYERDLLQFESFLAEEGLGLEQIKLVTKRHIQRYLAFLHRNQLCKSSVARKLSTLRSLFTFLLRSGEIEILPTAGIRNPKQDKLQPVVVNVDQAFALLEEAAKNDMDNSSQGKNLAQRKNMLQKKALQARDLALLELLYGSGLRISEALGLDVNKIDPSCGYVRVMGKGGKERQVPLSGTSREALSAWIALRGGIAPSDEPALFLGARGGAS